MLAALDRSLDRTRGVDDAEHKADAGRRDVVVSAPVMPAVMPRLVRLRVMIRSPLDEPGRRGTIDMRSFQVCTCGAAAAAATKQPTPQPTGTEVLLKVLAAGVCHSDLHIWPTAITNSAAASSMSLADRGMKLPLTMGHENVGEVVAVGPRRQGRQGRRRACWRIPGSAAANARSASAARRISADAAQASACSRNGGYADSSCWCRTRAICSTSAICRRSGPRRSPARASPPTAR